MSKLHAIIIEDEIPAARLLHATISSLRPEWDIEIIPGSVDDAVEWFATHPHPELIFLDIHLTDGDAFDLLSAVKPQSAVIFTTAYDQYAIRAFSVNSIDYILKPVDEQRLSEAIAKYESLHQQAWLQSEKYMETLLEALKHPERRYRSRFLISGVNEFWSLRVEEQLDPEQFFRVNRQMILNVDAIDRAIPYFKGRIKVIVHPSFKTDILISEGKASAFRLWLNY